MGKGFICGPIIVYLVFLDPANHTVGRGIDNTYLVGQ
jgi:hypothetical protein